MDDGISFNALCYIEVGVCFRHAVPDDLFGGVPASPELI